MCTLNIRSFTHPLHYTAIADLADTHNIHVFALTETWISSNTTSAQLFHASYSSWFHLHQYTSSCFWFLYFISSLLNKQAPLKSKILCSKPANHWFTPALKKLKLVTLTPVDSARNLGVIFENNLTFSQHISAISKSYFHDIRDLRRIRNTIDLTTACTIATSLIHSKVDYCNSLFTQSSCYSN